MSKQHATQCGRSLPLQRLSAQMSLAQKAVDKICCRAFINSRQNEAGYQAAFALEMAATISANSGLSEAPPTRKPSMSGIAESSAAFLALAEPPYWMRMASATVAEAFSEISLRMPAWVSCASCGVAVSPVPMAQTGS